LSLSPGVRLGPYEILSPLGAGGMGEVYRAADTKLKREVAIKVLPESLAQDPERLARFEREAQVLASLNHPHVAAIYGVEDSTSVKALVMELVDGTTLQDRLDSGPIAVEEALPIAKQIAEALEAAHEKGIVHRDLKPANVKITPDGVVKVLDFGLAKALDPAASGSSPDLSHSPTITMQATAAGVILGTAAYMSPEQARGSRVDKRADIWAFGVVLWEMLTGKRLFHGETVSDTLAAVLRADVDFASLPKTVPSEIRRLLRRCLERNPKNRLHDIADARIALDEIERGSSTGEAPSPTAAAPPRHSLIAWTLAAFLALLAGFFAWEWLSRPRPRKEPLTAFALALPEGVSIPQSEAPVVSMSPDGRTIVFAATDATGQRLYRRSLGEVAIAPIAGTEGAADPVISPDGKVVAFVAGQKLETIPISGGTPTVVADSPADRGIAWMPDGRILFSPSFDTGLMQVSSTGGTPVAVTKPDPKRNERSHRWPEVLPGGKAVIFSIGVLESPGDYDISPVAAVDLATGREKILVKATRMARFVAPDHLLFQRKLKLYSVRFDPKTLSILSAPEVVLEGVGGEVSSGAGYFAASQDGTLTCVPATALGSESQIVLVSRDGTAKPLPLPDRPYHFPRFSPDGKRIAFSAGSGPGASFLGTNDDVWTYDLASRSLNRLTFDSHDLHPIWSPDGRWIAYASASGTPSKIERKPSDGNGSAQAVWQLDAPLIPDDWSPGSASLLVTSLGEASHVKISEWLVPIEGAEKPHLLFPGEAASWGARLSPDGRYVAYTSLTSGSNSIFVRTFPPGAGRWQVSTETGMMPVWDHDGHELYYVHGDQMMTADVHAGRSFEAGPPRVLFTGPFDTRTAPIANFDVSPDGRTFLMIRPVGGAKPTRRIRVLLNFGDSLE
jgi:Tol biopolymer transport system component